MGEPENKMNKRTPQEIIGDDAYTQLIFEGYAVVPNEPNQNMMDAGIYQYRGDDEYGDVHQIYKDMIATFQTQI